MLKLPVPRSCRCAQGADVKPWCSLWLRTVCFNVLGVCLCLSPLSVDASRPRRLLQTHVLRNREPPLHGGHAEPGLCKQMRLLLEVKCWHSFTLGWMGFVPLSPCPVLQTQGGVGFVLFSLENGGRKSLEGSIAPPSLVPGSWGVDSTSWGAEENPRAPQCHLP